MSKKISRVLKIRKNTVNVNGKIFKQSISKIDFTKKKNTQISDQMLWKSKNSCSFEKIFSPELCRIFFLVWCIKNIRMHLPSQNH